MPPCSRPLTDLHGSRNIPDSWNSTVCVRENARLHIFQISGEFGTSGCEAQHLKFKTAGTRTETTSGPCGVWKHHLAKSVSRVKIQIRRPRFAASSALCVHFRAIIRNNLRERWRSQVAASEGRPISARHAGGTKSRRNPCPKPHLGKMFALRVHLGPACFFETAHTWSHPTGRAQCPPRSTPRK